MAAIACYVGLAAIVGFLGRRCVVGATGCFVFSLLFTPPLVALMLLITRRRSA
jgi:hypothetical protein